MALDSRATARAAGRMAGANSAPCVWITPIGKHDGGGDGHADGRRPGPVRVGGLLPEQDVDGPAAAGEQGQARAERIDPPAAERRQHQDAAPPPAPPTGSRAAGAPWPAPPTAGRRTPAPRRRRAARGLWPGRRRGSSPPAPRHRPGLAARPPASARTARAAAAPRPSGRRTSGAGPRRRKPRSAGTAPWPAPPRSGSRSSRPTAGAMATGGRTVVPRDVTGRRGNGETALLLPFAP